jgi:hypothetical protein
MAEKKKVKLEKLPNKETVSSSPERHTFQMNNYVKHKEEEGLEPLEEYIEMFKTWREQDEANLVDPEWQRNNLEYDLRSTSWIVEKARANKSYAQNIYAALCNMRWCNIKGNDPQVTMDILKDEMWSCSWRSAGGIVADMLGEGDYIDWYCSGIRNDGYQDDLSTKYPNNYVSEGVVTEEVAHDLKQLGWIPSEWPEDEK